LHTYCTKRGVPWFSSILDYPSFKELEIFNLFAIKIPSTISQHKEFIQQISNSKSELILISTGGTDLDYIKWILDVFEKKQLVVMQCTSSYPCELVDCNINVITTLKNIVDKRQHFSIIGYSSHDIGSLASQLALGLGAKVFEKHVKLGTVPWIHFDGVALDLKNRELGNYTNDIKTAKMALGSPLKTVLSSENHKYKPNDKHY
jgi:N-acetylneuraminate synthase